MAIQARAAERVDVAHALVAVDFLPPESIGLEMTRLAAELARGALRPIATTSYAMGDLGQANLILNMHA